MIEEHSEEWKHVIILSNFKRYMQIQVMYSKFKGY
jgi:hypothetical protein